MKALLSTLVCLILTTSQSFALKGGPFFGGASSVVGTYAGVLQPRFDPTSPASSNSIGLFSVTLPNTGTGTGTFVMFTQGRTFSGTIQAVGTPKNATLTGILKAQFNFTKIAPATGVSFQVTANVNGNMNAHIGSASQSSSAVSLGGTSTLFVDQGQISANNSPIITQVLTLTVAGYRQTNAASSATSASAPPAASP